MELDVVSNTGDSGTQVGSYFVANYPPFAVWSADHIPEVDRALDARPTGPNVPALGLYLHIPFCRKRCKFCYFRVYTDRNAADIERYLAALAREIELYARQPQFAGRQFEFAYFGGGTPSYLSSDQLCHLVERINRHWSWDQAREVTFECEPGTLKKSKLETIRAIGVTRLSLGVEHFDDAILELNGRAHKSPEIGRAYHWARQVGFDQINIDLIAGMVGDTDDTWRRTVDRALALAPDSLTVYQMEVPHNSLIARQTGASGTTPVADWTTKRAWVDYAFRTFEQNGYQVSSAYTVTRSNGDGAFVYRDALWHGADMVGTGVASFSYVDGVHYQNADAWEAYVNALEDGQLPLARALRATRDQQLIRELVLQLKLGAVDPRYFETRFGVNLHHRFADALASLRRDGMVNNTVDTIELTRAGLLQVDGLLPRFFEPEHRRIRST